jgi:uncharacterized protein
VYNSHGRFVWYELITTDVPAAMTFYRTVMGWDAWDASVRGKTCILFSDGKAAVSGLAPLSADATNTGASPSWVGYVAVDDVDATAGRITCLGGAVSIPPMNAADISRFSIFDDPQTARLALFKWLQARQEPPLDSGAPGRVGWHELLAADCDKSWAFYSALFGWQRNDADVIEGEGYLLFSAGGETIGGMFTKPKTLPNPLWLYYFNIRDIDATLERVKTGGGQILDGPLEVPGGSWVARCADPQGAIFAVEGKRNRTAVGYFERVGSRGSASAQSRRWSW